MSNREEQLEAQEEEEEAEAEEAEPGDDKENGTQKKVAENQQPADQVVDEDFM